MVGVRKLGRTVALHFARHGWRVLCASRTAADVEALARDVTAAGGQGVAAVCDLQRPESLARFAEDPPDLVVAAQTMGGRFGSLPLLEIPADGAGAVARRLSAGHLEPAPGGGPGDARPGSGHLPPNRDLLRGTHQGGVRSARRLAARAPGAGAGGRPRVAGARRPRRVSPRRRAHRLRADASAGLAVERLISPEAIAEACAYLHAQGPDAWTHELVLRPTGGDWSAPT